MRQPLIGFLAALLIPLGLALLFHALYPSKTEDRLVLEPATFADLPGWAEDDPRPALAAFARSCAKILARDPAASMGGAGQAGTAGDWQSVCGLISGSNETAATARSYFEENFAPVTVSNGNETTGLFTGYYEPELRASLTRAPPYEIPLYARPSDLVTVDLGLFKPEWRGQRLGGRVREGALTPFPDRAEIDRAGLGDTPVLAWLQSPVDAFFLHIQGSGRLTLPDGSPLRVGYDSQNGHPYVAIGKTLIARGAIAREAVSMQSIRDWLAANPSEAGEVMATNPSYVFFRKLDLPDPALGALGAQDVQLTPGRSLAVDRKFHALGVPVWLAATVPAAEEGAADKPFRRLMIAQDTGGAIRGPVRGDVYWGWGRDAEAIAGRMKNEGRFWILLPKAVAARLTAS